MPRRMIDGNLTRSRSLSQCSVEASFLFVAAISTADDQGRLDGDPLLLKADLFPLRREVSEEQIGTWLDELVTEGCLHRYEVEGRWMLHFPAWTEYQRLRKPGEDRRPDPADHCPQCRGEEPQGVVIEQEVQKREARSGKREAGGKCGNSPQVAASRRKSPQPAAKKEKARKDKYLVPDELTTEQMIKVKAWTNDHYPDMSDHVETLANQCLRHHQSTENRQRYTRWVSVVENWIERQATQFGGMNGGKTNKQAGDDRYSGPLGQIYLDQMARSRGQG